jgi:hypothetical protein
MQLRRMPRAGNGTDGDWGSSGFSSSNERRSLLQSLERDTCKKQNSTPPRQRSSRPNERQDHTLGEQALGQQSIPFPSTRDRGRCNGDGRGPWHPFSDGTIARQW